MAHIQSLLSIVWLVFVLWTLFQILLEDSDSGPKWGWVLFIFITGGLGIVLYYFFGRDSNKK